jgi:hypothetical protein
MVFASILFVLQIIDYHFFYKFCQVASMRTIKRPFGDIFTVFILFVLCACISSSTVSAQEITKTFLRKLDWYKYSNISVFESDGAAQKRLSESLTPGYPRTQALETAEQECTNTDDIKKRVSKKQQVPQTMIDEGGSPQDCEAVKAYYTALAGLVRIGKVYIIAERYQDGNDPVILGVVSIQSPTQQQAADPDFLKNALNAPIGVGVLDASELRQFKTKEYEKDDSTGAMQPVKGSIEGTGAENLYDYIKGIIKQNPIEKTTSIRPNQSVAMKINKEIVTKMIGEDKVSDYLMISEGEPHKAMENDKSFSDEIVVGVADLVSWRHYQDPASVQGEPTNLPQYGVELRYGAEDVGYPSLLSERVAINALWDANKIGIILPSSLWAPQLIPLLNQQRKFATLGGGVGLNASFDFPFKLIERSGVFTAAGSYLLGNNIRNNDFGEFARTQTDAQGAYLDSSRRNFLMRAHGLLNYTFSIAITDPDRETVGYYIRIKLGGAGYSMEQWQRPTASSNETAKVGGSTLKAGFFARVEFMSAGLSVPFGSYVQFFDGALSGNVWLQVPISDTGFLTAIRIDGKLFAPLTRGPYEWESSVMAIPSVRFIFRW